jgi:hypothetical protein
MVYTINSNQRDGYLRIYQVLDSSIQILELPTTEHFFFINSTIDENLQGNTFMKRAEFQRSMSAQN